MVQNSSPPRSAVLPGQLLTYLLSAKPGWALESSYLAGNLRCATLLQLQVMAVVRILVDGYSLLHAWADLAPGEPRYTAAARDILVDRLRRYQDAIGTPLTLVFDGNRPGPGAALAPESTRYFEVLYSASGQTADDLIERVTSELSRYGDVIVVTNDLAEQDTVTSLGALPSSCEAFVQQIQTTLSELERDLERHNRKERMRFRKR